MLVKPECWRAHWLFYYRSYLVLLSSNLIQILFSPTSKSKSSLKKTLKRWKFCLLAKEKESLCVPLLLTLKFAPRAALICDKQYQVAALEGSSSTAGACLLNFWLSPGLQDPPCSPTVALGLFTKQNIFFFLWIFTLQWVLYCVLLCTREPVFVQRLGSWWHKSSCWKQSCLSFQQDKLLCLCEIFLLQNWDLLECKICDVLYLYRRCNK